MSVLIKGMEMPKSCFGCRFCRNYDEPKQGHYCMILVGDLSKILITKIRAGNCPLVELPKYCRLIDAAELQREAYDMLFRGHADDRDVAFLNFVLQKVPTIATAEEGKE